MSEQPVTDAEWRDAVDAAYVATVIDAAKKYGLVNGPAINLDRAEELLREGKARGFEPSPDAIDRVLRGSP